VTQEEEPGLIASLPLFDEFERVLVEDIGGVKFTLWPIDFFLASGRKAFVEAGIPLIVRMVKRVAKELLESTLRRPGLIVEVPFTDVIRTVAGTPKRLAERDSTVV